MSAAISFRADAATPSLIASTGLVYNCSIAETALRESKGHSINEKDEQSAPSTTPKEPSFRESNTFRSVEWSVPKSTILN